MNKKYLSAILFGALMLGSTGTFTSCKDYDDDISNLQTQITANADAIKALQDKINSGKWITSVAAIEGGFTVTFSDGQSFNIVNGAAGAKGTEWTIGEDGYWYKDGNKTEYKAAISDETTKVVVPTIKDGYWYLVDEETGELVATEYKANGAAYAVAEANGGYTIYMPNEDGTEVEEIYVPGAAGSITSMTAQLIDNFPADQKDQAFTVKKFTFNLNDKDRTEWKSLTGKDATTNKYILASADEIGLRINPVNVDASEIEFSLYNSKNEVLPYVTLLPTEYQEYVTKAAYGNGLYALAMKKAEAKDDAALKTLTDLFATANGNIAYAVSATTACRAEYNISVKKSDETANLNGIKVNKDAFSEKTDYATNGNKSTVDSKATNVVSVGAPSDLYDMWLSVENEDKNLFDIVFDQEKHTFVVNADPDVITKSYFDLTITTINNSGVYSETIVRINVSSKIAADPTYEKISHTIIANKTDKSDANYFTAQMSIMTEALGSQLDAWKKNLANGSVAFYTDAECTKGEIAEAASGIALTFISADGKTDYTGNDIKNAALMKFYVTNATAAQNFVVDKVYYAKVTFSGAQGELNSIVIPFEFKIPALSTMFEQKSAYVVDGIINAYFYNTANKSTAVEFNKYFSKFVDDATVSLVADEKINNKLTNTLFQFSTTTTFDEATIDLISGKSATGAGQNGYGQAVTINATKSNYEGWTYQTKGDNTYSFKIRLMSPIYEGTVVPAAGSTITISANDLVNGALITDADIIGKDYNGNTYTVVPDKVNGNTPAWANPQIDNVSAAQDKDQYIKAVETVAAKTVDGKTVNGGFKLTGESISNTVTVEMPVSVTDAWGYIRTVGVSVTITKN